MSQFEQCSRKFSLLMLVHWSWFREDFRCLSSQQQCEWGWDICQPSNSWSQVSNNTLCGNLEYYSHQALWCSLKAVRGVDYRRCLAKYADFWSRFCHHLRTIWAQRQSFHSWRFRFAELSSSVRTCSEFMFVREAIVAAFYIWTCSCYEIVVKHCLW